MTIQENIAAFIQKSEALAVELETELCRRPAVSPDSGGEGELDKCVFLEEWLRSHGINALERFDAPDERAKGGVRPSLIATIAGRAAPGAGRLWIISHLDVVPPGELSLWENDPWTAKVVEGGVRADGSPLGPRITGRGTEDNQQGLVSSVLAALALLHEGEAPAMTVKLLFAADEENGSRYGVHWLLENHRDLFQQNDMALIPDGGDRKGESIEVAEKNLIWARFATSGVQTHGSRPDLGANAHLAAADLAVRLHYGLGEKFGARDPLFEPDRSTFEPTKKEVNVPNINTIPGEDVFYMDMRVLPRYPVKDVLAEADRIKAEVESLYGVKVRYDLPQSSESVSTSPGAPLVRLVSSAVRKVYGVTTRPVGIGGGTVGAPLRNVGIDSAVWCRIEDTAHQPNEYALIGNILGDAQVMALLMTEGAS
ncbi:MAG: M20 family metallo-hydrolase [Treponema sp.]|jgi:succinyl-diaminopimelate desuccinylase|nr:M20 family metallo-hydrolase [Treponema sp.]